MNTRVVFKEPRGMIRWLQLFFAIIAFSTVADFTTNVGITITCPPTTASSTTVAPPASTNVSTPAPAGSSTSSTQAPSTASSTLAPISAPGAVSNPKLMVSYPFDFSQQKVENTCPGYATQYTHNPSLNGSPQFFVMTGVLALIYASLSLVVYLFFSSTYDSVPVWPVADLIIAAILCLFWFIASSSFSSGVSLLKSTVVYESVEQVLCPPLFKTAGGTCAMSEEPSWKSLNVGLVSGFTSFFLWGTGMWFVYKETHFHTPRDTYGLPR